MQYRALLGICLWNLFNIIFPHHLIIISVAREQFRHVKCNCRCIRKGRKLLFLRDVDKLCRRGFGGVFFNSKERMKSLVIKVQKVSHLGGSKNCIESSKNCFVMIYGRLTIQTPFSISKVALHNLKIIKYKQILFEYTEMQTPPFS